MPEVAVQAVELVKWFGAEEAQNLRGEGRQL